MFIGAADTDEASVPSPENSSFALSHFERTANGSTLATANIDVYNAAGEPLSAKTVVLSTALVEWSDVTWRVTLDKTVVASDGVEVVTGTISAMRTVEGRDWPVVGIPASYLVVTVEGGAASITQPASATDAAGEAEFSFTTTEAAATLTAVVTVRTVYEVTSQPTVTTDGTAGEEDSFTETFADGVYHDADGVTNGDAEQVTLTGGQMRMRWEATAAGVGDRSEKRWAFGRNVTEIWIEYKETLPANYAHRAAGVGGATNNKEIRLWGDSYSATNKVGASTWRNTGYASGSSVRWDRTTTSGIGPSAPSGGGATSPTWEFALAPAVQSTVRFHFRMESATNANDQLSEMWIDGVLMDSWDDQHQIYDTARPYWNAMYVKGYANSGFDEQTDILIDDLTFHFTDPGW